MDDVFLINQYGLSKILKLDEKLRDTSNEIRERNGKLADSIADLMKTLVTHVGVILSVAIPVVGATILISMAIYSVLDRVGYNPFRWIGNKLFDHPFKKKDHFTSIDNIKNIVNKLNAKNKNDKLAPSMNIIQEKIKTLPPKPARKVVYNDRKILASDSPIFSKIRIKNPPIRREPSFTLMR